MDIRTRFTLVLVSIMAAGTVAMVAHAQSSELEAYLYRKTPNLIELDVVVPEPIIQENTTLWIKIKRWLGTRVVPTIKPAVGTSFTVTSSAYASSPYQTDSSPCVTAAGTRVRQGVVASNFLPIGTILDINGNSYIVEDRMNPRYDGYFVDIWFTSTREALEFGRKKQTIVVVGYGEPGQPLPGEEDEENTKLAKAESRSILERLRDGLQTITVLLGTRVAEDVNKYDVDCLSQE